MKLVTLKPICLWEYTQMFSSMFLWSSFYHYISYRSSKIYNERPDTSVFPLCLEEFQVSGVSVSSGHSQGPTARGSNCSWKLLLGEELSHPEEQARTRTVSIFILSLLKIAQVPTFYTCWIRMHFVLLGKFENCTILIPTGNSYCRCKSSAKDLNLKSHPKDYHLKLTH